MIKYAHVIKRKTKEDYNRRMCDDNRTSLVPPEIPTNTKFELPGHILSMLKDTIFPSNDYEDAYKQIGKVVEIENWFNGPNLHKDAVMLRLFLLTLKGATKEWLESLPFGEIMKWDDLKFEFIQQFTPPSKISKLK